MAGTAGIVNGTNLKISIGGTAVAYTTNASVDFTMATRDTTNKDSAGWSSSAEGLRSGTISGDYLFAFDASYGFEELFAAFSGRTKLTVKLGTSNADDKAIEGEGYLTALNAAAPMEDTISGSFTIQFTGAITFTT